MDDAELLKRLITMFAFGKREVAEHLVTCESCDQRGCTCCKDQCDWLAKQLRTVSYPPLLWREGEEVHS